MFHERTKHIDVKYHYIRDVISQGKLKVCNISTHDNPADMMTKPVPVALLKLSWFDSLTQEAIWRQKFCSLLCSGDDLICYKKKFVLRWSMLYVIQILYKKNANFRRFAPQFIDSSCKPPLGVVHKHPIQ